MSRDPDRDRRAFERSNDPYRDAEVMAEDLWQLVQNAVQADEVNRISDETARLLMTAAVKLYARKTDGEARTFRPLKGQYDEVISPTEALTATTEILRALRLGPMEFGLWSRRRPEDYHLISEKSDEAGAARTGMAEPGVSSARKERTR